MHAQEPKKQVSPSVANAEHAVEARDSSAINDTRSSGIRHQSMQAKADAGTRQTQLKSIVQLASEQRQSRLNGLSQSDEPIQRYIHITGYRDIDNINEIDGLVKDVADTSEDRKHWPQFKVELRAQFAQDKTYASLDALKDSIYEAADQGRIKENLEQGDQHNLEAFDDGTFGFDPTKFGDLQRDHKDRPQTIKLEDDGLFHTNIWNAAQNRFALARGTYAFIKKIDGPLVFGKHGHEHLGKDHNVEFAGEATFNAGTLLFWTNNSGHYVPDPRAMHQAGLPMSKFVPLGFVEDSAVQAAYRNFKSPEKIARLFGVPAKEIIAAFNRLGIERMNGGRWQE